MANITVHPLPGHAVMSALAPQQYPRSAMRADAQKAQRLPRQVGKYRILGRLGEGATSEVLLGRDEFHGREVAIKCVRPPDSAATPGGDSQFYERFFAAEAALVGRLQHPNIVQIYDAVADPKRPHLVMEYVPGTTLKAFCRPDALLPLEQIVEIGFKCAMALGFVARQGLIHRDVKPANLLALMDGDRLVDVKITDFGSVLQLDAERTQIHRVGSLAYVARHGLIHRDVKPANILAVLKDDQITDIKITDFGSVFDQTSDRTQVFRVGSLAYMPPEQLDGSTLDTRADMYALAAVLYHLVSGRPPFDAPNQVALMHQIYHAEPVPLAGLREGVPPRMDALLRQALSKQPSRRPADWDCFAREWSLLVANGEVPVGRLQDVLRLPLVPLAGDWRPRVRAILEQAGIALA